MDAKNRDELFVIVLNAIAEHDVAQVANVIDAANRGRPDGQIVTNRNQHLFRQYRNKVSGNAAQLLREAVAAKASLRL